MRVDNVPDLPATAPSHVSANPGGGVGTEDKTRDDEVGSPQGSTEKEPGPGELLDENTAKLLKQNEALLGLVEGLSYRVLRLESKE